MTTANTNIAIEICSSALSLIGADTILSFDDESQEARVANAIYETYRNALLQEHRWRFAIKKTSLAQLSDAPLYGYDHAYQLPSDFLLVVSPNDATFTDYEIFENTMHTDADIAQISYLSNPGEARYPAYFKLVLQLRLAYAFATAITQDAALAKVYEAQYLRELIRAKSIDSQQQPNGVFSDNNFVFNNVRVL